MQRTEVSRGATPTGLIVGFLGLLALAVFLLVWPLLDDAPAYRPRPPGTVYGYIFVVLAAFAPFALAVAATRRGLRLRTAVIGAAILHATLLPAALTQSQDMYMYLFYGKAWAVYGANPYLVPPQAFASDPWFAHVLWPTQTTVYGPLWTLVSGGLVKVAGSSLTMGFVLMKLTIGALTALAVIGLIRAARARGEDPALAVVLFAWNPLVLVSVPLGAHIEVMIAGAFVWAAWADSARREVTAALLLTAATLVKAYAGLALLLYLAALLRRRGRALQAATAALGLAALAWLPFWDGIRTLSGILGVAAGFSSTSLTGLVQESLGWLGIGDAIAATAVRVVAVLVLLVVSLRMVRREDFPTDPWPGVAAAFAAYVLVTPWFLYWHQVGLLAIAVVAGSNLIRTSALVFSGTSMLTVSGGTAPGRVFQAAARYGIPVWAGLRSARERAGEKDRRR